MPTWRKLHTKVLDSDDINDMPDDFTRLFWYNLTLVVDREGRGINKATWLRSKTFPIRENVTTEQICKAIQYFASKGMIEIYTVEGRSYFWIPKFNDYQNTTKEALSLIPEPTRSGQGLDKVWIRSGTEKEKEKETVKEKEKETVKDVVKEKTSSPTNFIGEFVNAVRVQFTNGDQSETIKDLVDDYGESVVLEVATWYGQNNPRNMGHALKSINTALSRGWNVKDAKNNNEKVLEEWLNGNKRISDETDPEIVSASPANQTNTGNA